MANALTVIRMFCSVFLLFSRPFSAVFWGLYVVCGFSDVADGYVARKTKTESKAGALLDSIADIVFTIVIFVKMIAAVVIPMWVWLWIGGIAALRFGSYVIGYFKYRTFSSLHTLANKSSGFLLFSFPVLYVLLGVNRTAVLVCMVSSVAAVEEFLIIIRGKALDRNCRGVWRM